MSTLIVLILIAAVFAFFMLRSGENLRFETSSDPHRVVMAAVGIVGAKRRWQTMAQGPHGANFQYHKGPNVLVALVLLLCFLIPGIVYILLAGKRESLVVNIDSATTGMTVVQVTSNGFRGKGAGHALRRQVSLPAGALGSAAAAALTGGGG
jgi:Ca2+/Na+ antiporter